MDELLLACLAGAGGVALLRWSWSRKRRLWPVNAAGWGLLLAGSVLGWMAAGAWGLAVASLVAMTLATALLAWAAITAPAGKARSSQTRVRMLPDSGEPLRLGGRVVTFLLVVVGGLAASIALGIALQIAALGLGWQEADATATALIGVPLIWGVLATVLLMLEKRRGQMIALLVTSLPFIPALLAGS